MTEPIEINVDATSLRSSGCILEWYRRVVEGWRAPIMNNDIIYGIAVHKFIDTMFKTHGNMKEARVAAEKSFNIPKYDKPKKLHMSDARHMLATCVDYWDKVQNDDTFETLLLPNNQPATEITFRFLYCQDEWVKIYLCGTMDKIGKIKGGCYAIGDYKTTSSWNDKEYFEGYELSLQLRFYIFALQWMAAHEPDSVLGQIGAKQPGAFIDALFIKTKVVENEYKRSNVFRFKSEDMAEFVQLLDAKIQHLVGFIRTQHLTNVARPPKEGIISGLCERKFGKCDFWHVCKNDDRVGEVLLRRDFVKKHYNPLKFNED